MGFCVFEIFTSRNFGHEANPKSVKGRPDRAALDGKPQWPNEFTPIDKTIDLVVMMGRQKGIDGHEKGCVPVSIARSEVMGAFNGAGAQFPTRHVQF